MARMKRQDLQGQELPTGQAGGGLLSVVATPIGNLGDLSTRAREALQSAGVIYCEDTRRTRNLLVALGIAGPRLERLDAHASPAAIERAAQDVAQGLRAALVTDAGTPGVSDPAAALVARLRELDVPVTPIPGASAVVALLSVSGFAETSFAFRGFFPRSSGDRRREVETCARLGDVRVVSWFESPERVVSALESLAGFSPPGTCCVAGKELTKLHEKFFSGEVAEVLAQVRREIEVEGARGEWCFVAHFPAAQQQGSADEGESANWDKALRLLLEAGVAVSEASRRISQSFAVPKKRVYEAALQQSDKKSGEGG